MTVPSVFLQLVFALQCLGNVVQQEHAPEYLHQRPHTTSVIVDSQGEIQSSKILRQQEEVKAAPAVEHENITAVEQMAEAQVGGKKECDYSITQQMVRIAGTVYKYKPDDLEMGVKDLPKWLKWTHLNMKDCGWKIKLWECVAPCNKENHDNIMVAYNEHGNPGVKPKTCALAFTGRDDEDETEGGLRNLYGMKKDKKTAKKKQAEAKKAEKAKKTEEADEVDSLLDLGKAKLPALEDEDTDVMYHWDARISGKEVVTTKFHQNDYANYRTATMWGEVEKMATNGTCEHVVFTGHSNGGAVAQMMHVDVADGTPDGELESTCYNGKTNCTAIVYSTIPAFTKNAPKFKSCDGNWMIAAKEDAAVPGTSSPPGPNIDEYEEIHGEGMAKEVNIPFNYKRLYLEYRGLVRGFSSVKGKSEGCMADVIKNGNLQKLQRRIWDQPVLNRMGKTGEGIKQALIYFPWHLVPYLVFSVDAWAQDRDNFFTHPGAAVYFAMWMSENGQNTRKYDKKDHGVVVDETGAETKTIDTDAFKGVRDLQDAINEMLGIDGLLDKSGEEDGDDHASLETKAKVNVAAVKIWTALKELSSMDIGALAKLPGGPELLKPKIPDVIPITKKRMKGPGLQHTEPEKEEVVIPKGRLMKQTENVTTLKE